MVCSCEAKRSVDGGRSSKFDAATINLKDKVAMNHAARSIRGLLVIIAFMFDLPSSDAMLQRAS